MIHEASNPLSLANAREHLQNEEQTMSPKTAKNISCMHEYNMLGTTRVRGKREHEQRAEQDQRGDDEQPELHVDLELAKEPVPTFVFEFSHCLPGLAGVCQGFH